MKTFLRAFWFLKTDVLFNKSKSNTRYRTIKIAWVMLIYCKYRYWSFWILLQGPRRGRGSFHFFGNFKELLRKRCFQHPPPPPPTHTHTHFESLVSSPTFKVAPRALYYLGIAQVRFMVLKDWIIDVHVQWKLLVGFYFCSQDFHKQIFYQLFMKCNWFRLVFFQVLFSFCQRIDPTEWRVWGLGSSLQTWRISCRIYLLW